MSPPSGLRSELTIDWRDWSEGGVPWMRSACTIMGVKEKEIYLCFFFTHYNAT